MNLRLALSFFGLVFSMVFMLELAHAEYPGVIELVGYSNRRARTHFMSPSYSLTGSRQSIDSTQAPPASKTQADIETVKQNIEKYNKLLTLDTKNLPESQKDMLERIVERVARLKETLDIEESQMQQKNATNSSKAIEEDSVASTSTAPSTLMETETNPTFVLDETTLLHLQTTMDELAAAQAVVTAQTTQIRDLPNTTELNLDTETANDSSSSSDASDELNSSNDFVTTTIIPQTDETDADEQFVAARANNKNIAAITADDGDLSSTLGTTNTLNQQRTLTTSSKLGKTRATKKPVVSDINTATSTSKRGQRPNHQSTAGLFKQTMTTKQKLAAAAVTTTQPLQYSGSTKQKQQPQQQQQQQQLQHYQQKVSISDKNAAVTSVAPGIEQRTSPSSVAAYGTSSTNSYNDMVYDEHVNTSSIIDSLNNAREEFYQHKHTVNNIKDKKPSSATAKPTKYHYYPHNQHIYLLPECAIQQVCNAVYVRLNYTQPLCACPSRYRDPCSASLNEDDQHTTKLVGDGKKKAITLAKTCEATTEMRECRSPKDWSLLALQNTRTGKSHYLVICRCPEHFKMDGPMAHDQPTYASVPGIRVFGMMCVKPGHSLRKPSVQPPKRYQLQKPFYRPNTQSSFINNNKYVNGGSSNSQSGFNKDNYGRPIYGSGSSTSAFSSSNSNSNYHNTQHDNGGGYQQPQKQQSIISQKKPSYQYLTRPESIHSSSSNSYHPDTLTSINNFPGSGNIYGRNNERQGEAPIEAQPVTNSMDEDGKILISTSTQPTEEARTTLIINSELTTSSKSNEQENLSLETHSEESKLREKRSIVEDNEIETYENDFEMPEFPWDRVIEFQKLIHWD